MLTVDGRPTLPQLLDSLGLAGVAEEPFPNDGWSGAQLTRLPRAEGFIVKRTSWATDWIVRATADHDLRETWVANGALALPEPLVPVHLGAARDGDGAAIVMPDLSAALIPWERSGGASVPLGDVDHVVSAIARIHGLPVGGAGDGPWCPLPERLGLLTRPAGERYRSEGLAVGARFIEGWDAFDRLAPAAGRDLVARLSVDLGPLVRALGDLPAAVLHGDLKLANVAILDRDRVGLIDWQMVSLAPVAVELGWLLVSNVAILPEPPTATLARYRHHAVPPVVGDWEAQVDLTWIVGLLLRGWRKGLDAEAGTPTGWGATGRDDLAWWCEQAVEAADRRL